MKLFSFYHTDTGLLAPTKFSTDDVRMLKNNIPANHAAIEGHHDHLTKRVDLETKTIVDYQPPQPSPDHEWNADTKRWQLTAQAQDKINRRKAALARIAQLESGSLRTIREAQLGMAGAEDRLKELDAEIAVLRSAL
jgi:hypothetical protein